ncbi:MAG TPA: hypothetical protein VMF61_09965 [Candidatus Acidoferrales bacterium]|nr:hypothetical protein [Candidatus Acidoferrales bacterium]
MSLSRFLASAAAVAALAACSSGGNPAVSPAVPAASAAAEKGGPVYGIAIELPDGKRAHTSQAEVRSLKAVTAIVKGKRYASLTESPTGCGASDESGTFAGCEVILDGSTTFDVKKAVFSFYSGAKGKGCLLASGTYSGDMGPGIVGVTFKIENAKKCWK